MIRVRNEVEIYEREGLALLPGEEMNLTILSHWDYPDRVVILLPPGVDGTDTITVLARDLEAAVQNARNTNRHG